MLPRQRRHVQRRSAAIDFEDDVVGGFCPDQRFRVGVVVRDVVVDGAFEFVDAVENPAADALGGDGPEPALHQVQPRRRGGGEMKVPTLSLGVLQPRGDATA